MNDDKDYQEYLKYKKLKIDKYDFFKNHILGRNVDTYLPFYDEFSDYNTNAKSYYDYLARYNKMMMLFYDFINRLLRRDLIVLDTKSIEIIKNGSWIDNGECKPNNFDDLIELLANVKISKLTETYFINEYEIDFIVNNAISIRDDGIFAPDYIDLIEDLYSRLKNLDDRIINIENELIQLDNRITNNENKINNLENALQKIVDNLFSSGAITNNNINTFNFKTGRDIATGNINLFGGTVDGSSFIRTNSGNTENDITAGI